MKADTYTKVILTVIAVCLTVNTAMKLDLMPKAYADNGLNDLKPNSQYGLVPLNENGLVEVSIKDINTYDELYVNLRGVDTSEEVNINVKSIDTSDELDVNIDELGGTWLNPGGPIKVQVQN
ncbi:hypothetical protein [Gilvibacter sp.]|uniref:hypothetical protein n=1 Tax=Gilvibacter sp. TaxID=2729997 RepID=UPI0025B977AB|nr:hypothetical protein [Gilvibacter sp.]NQX78259.1 hypothetical protein [Gilvibacter sp.]